MSSASDFLGGGGKIRYQDFTSSGTFTPNTKLLSRGGQVLVLLVAGGGAGGGGTNTTTFGSGGDAGQLIERFVTVSGPVTVTIGAGGAGVSGGTGNSGGDSSFGALLTATGGRGARANSFEYVRGGAGAAGLGAGQVVGSINGAVRGGPGLNGLAGGGAGAQANGNMGVISYGATDGGGNGGASAAANGGSATANTGGGGGGAGGAGTATTGGSGGSGFCRVMWTEG